ncbi:hypothetical protein [Marivirga sp.]|uniref:hypothetical protein n=1 Tax=Marivirga sp. TaxID=2018662 RepID=UPI003DA73225
MKSNIILSISTALMQVARVAIALLAGVLVVLVVGSFVNDSLTLSDLSFQVSFLDSESAHTIYTVAEDNFWISIIVIIQKLSVLIIWFQILGYGKDIVANIKSIKTFAKDNVKAFSNLSRLSIILLLIHIPTLSSGKIGIRLEFNYLFLAFAAIILTQVFKEGQNLMEENELTV